MKLITEINESIEYIVEEKDGKKSMHINGVFMMGETKNRNGRIYPRELWEAEIQKYQENFASGSINTLMEWEHPARTNVDPMEAVAKITKLHIKDKYVMGEAVLLDNQKANQLKSLIDNGVKISVSSRGVGSVKNGVVENFKLVTYDVVAAPSDYNASMNGLVESYKLSEGIIDDLTFSIDEFGNIVHCNNVSGSFDKKEIDSAILSKFKELLEEIKK